MKYQNYVEMPFKKAFESFPQVFKCFPKYLIDSFLSDDDYIVRIDKKTNYFEVGFASDNWNIN